MDIEESSPESHSDKRRKLRKGTHSCWECKRRKVKCTFGSAKDKTCIPCQRRKARCISQSLPDEVESIGKSYDNTNPWGSEETTLAERMLKVEKIVERLSGTSTLTADGESPNKRMVEERVDTNIGFPTPTGSDQSTPIMKGPITTRITADSSNHTKISEALIAAFPSSEDADSLCNMIGKGTDMWFQMNTRPRYQLRHDDVRTGDEAPHRGWHPVLLAKRMLIIALCILHLHPQLPTTLSESPHAIMFRLASTASNLVAKNEEFFGSVESLECMMLHGLFEQSSGNLRRGWLAVRRAMSAAQMMGIHLRKPPRLVTLDPNTKIDPHFTWFRIVYMDRHLCLLLGLPAGSTMTEFPTDGSPGSETPIARFERMHAVVALRILTRNESEISHESYTATETIDAQLLGAANELPPQFWLPVNFIGIAENSPELFWETTRFMDQINHYTLVNLTHLPQLLNHGIKTSPAGANEGQVAYSKLACVNASREILTRYLAFRRFAPVATCCRPADFATLMAAMTLLLAHLQGHHQKNGNILAHQRLGDRAMMQQVLERMNSHSRYIHGPLMDESVRLLGRLLDVEDEAAHSKMKDAGQEVKRSINGSRAILDISIPYLGSVRVGHEGIINIADHRAQNAVEIQNQSRILEGIPGADFGSVHIANHDFFFEVTKPIQIAPLDSASLRPEIDLESRQILNSEPVVNMEDWAFPNVDGAFFDDIMKGSGISFQEVDSATLGWDLDVPYAHDQQ